MRKIIMKRVILKILTFLVCANVFADNLYIINRTRSDVVIGYDVCSLGNHGKINRSNYYECGSTVKFTVPSMSKIDAPWPDTSMPDPSSGIMRINSYLVSIESTSGAFKPRIFFTNEDWDKICNGKKEAWKNPGCIRHPIELTGIEFSVQSATSIESNLSGAWVIEDYGVRGFISMNFRPFGASQMRY